MEAVDRKRTYTVKKLVLSIRNSISQEWKAQTKL
jgi:hypothetical protein